MPEYPVAVRFRNSHFGMFIIIFRRGTNVNSERNPFYFASRQLLRRKIENDIHLIFCGGLFGGGHFNNAAGIPCGNVLTCRFFRGHRHDGGTVVDVYSRYLFAGITEISVCENR